MNPLSAFKKLQAEIQANRGKELIGLPFPYHAVNEITSGLRPGMLYVLGGYTSTGKSTIANEIGYHLVEEGERVVVFSLEMSKELTMLRVASRHSGVHHLKILLGKFDHVDETRIEEAYRMMERADFTVHDNLYTMKKIEATLLREVKESGVSLAVIDFIQNIMGDEPGIYSRMAQAALDCQRIARQADVPLLVLSQVDNESVRNPSGLIGYKGAGEIAAAADVGFWIERIRDASGKEDRENPGVTLEIRKHRHGALGKTKLYWKNSFTTLSDSVFVPSISSTTPADGFGGEEGY